MKITHALCALALCAAPVLAASVQNGTFDEPVLLTANAVLPSVILPTAPEPPEPVVQRVAVKRTVVVAPKRRTHCYSRKVELNANGGTVRICEPASASAIARRTASDLL
jgi:hypothetical protein